MLTKFASCMLDTVVAFEDPVIASAVVVAATVGVAILPRPSQLALALVVRRAGAAAVHAVLVAGSVAEAKSISLEASVAVAFVGAVHVLARGVLVALVHLEQALVDVGTRVVGPLHGRHGHCGIVAFVRLRTRSAGRSAEISQNTRSDCWILLGVAPPAPEILEAGGTVLMDVAEFALSQASVQNVDTVAVGLVEPLAAPAVLELAGVDGEEETLLRAVAPHAPALSEAGRAVGSLVARGGAAVGVG